jgi:hypothetical protein
VFQTRYIVFFVISNPYRPDTKALSLISRRSTRFPSRWECCYSYYLASSTATDRQRLLNHAKAVSALPLQARAVLMITGSALMGCPVAPLPFRRPFSPMRRLDAHAMFRQGIDPFISAFATGKHKCVLQTRIINYADLNEDIGWRN